MGCNERNFHELPLDWNCHVRVSWNGLQWVYFQEITPWLKLTCQRGLQWAARGGHFRNYPPDWICHVRVECNGLQWEDFSGINPWLKLPCKSALQWAAMGGLFRNYPLTEIDMSEWAAMGGLFRNYPPDWNCQVRVGCNGLQWEDFSGITPWLKLPCMGVICRLM